MNLPPFLLDHWLAAHEFADPPIRFNLAASTGPRWTVRELLAVGGSGPEIGDIAITYAPPEGSRALREAIAGFYGLDPDWVVVTTGASEAISVLFCLLQRPKGNVVLPAPAFPAFEAMANAWGLAARHYELVRETSYRQRASDVVAAADRDTVLALVSTPHNPVGTAMPAAEAGALAAELDNRGVPLVVDEVYHPLYFGAAVPSAATLTNTILVSDMSKALSLPGLRVGWIIDADAERRKRIIDARSYFTISSSPITEALTAHALRNGDAILERLRQVATANLGALESLATEAAEVLAWVRPDGGTVSFPWFRDGRDSRPFCEALAAEGVLVVPGDCFGKPDHMRVGFGAQATGFIDAVEIVRRKLIG